MFARLAQKYLGISVQEHIMALDAVAVYFILNVSIVKFNFVRQHDKCSIRSVEPRPNNISHESHTEGLE